MNIGKAIKEIRQSRKMSQSEFAEKCELTQGSISKIENGIVQPSKANLTKICEVLSVSEVIIQFKAIE